MLKEEYASLLEGVVDKARFLASLDVIDVKFVSGHTLELYVANTPEQRARGLANIASIDSDGMLFYYPQLSYRPYTMAEMQFDLDIAWYDQNGKLLDVKTCPAGMTEPVYASYGYHYVIETPSGTLPFADLEVRPS